MTRPLCPMCNTVLEALRRLSDVDLSCPACGWTSNKTQRRALQSGGGAGTIFLKQLPSLEEARDIFGSLLTVSKPRILRWNWRMKAVLAVLALIMCLLTWVLAEYFGNRGFREPLIILILVGWVAVLISFPLLPELSHRRVMSEGELAVGRVVYQTAFSGGRSTWSVIFYAFADGSNRGFVGKGTDLSDSLAHGAPVVVFYDALDPDKNVAMECSRFEVKLP